ncbi:LuxR C-terminal-related transcriptional regulator [Thermaurantiacus sp.]
MNGPAILVADDHPAFRAALALAARRAAPGARLLEAGDLATALHHVREAQDLALILLDLGMPGASGFSGLAQLHAERPGTPIVVISAANPEAAGAARAYGARSFLSKSADLGEIEAAIVRALGDEPEPEPVPAQEEAVKRMAADIARLTPTQLKVLLGVLEGKLNKQIAHGLGISEATVKGHMTALMRKLGVHNRTQVALAARALALDPASARLPEI